MCHLTSAFPGRGDEHPGCSAAGSIYACCIGFTAGGSISAAYIYICVCVSVCAWVWKAWLLAVYDRAERNVYYGSGVCHQMMRMTKVAPCFQVATTEWFCQRSRTEMLFPLINESGSFNIKLFPLPVMTPPYCLSATNEWNSFPRQGITSLVLAVLMGESMQGANGRGICLDD